MKKNLELKWEQLKTSYQFADFPFQNTDELEAESGMLNQGEGINMLEFGLGMKAKDYNIYVSGEDEKALYDYIIQKVEETASKENTPDDLCYIYHFENPSSPKAIRMQPGDGKKFQDDMKEFKHFLIDDLADKLESYEAEQRRQKVIDEMTDKKDKFLKELKIGAKTLGFKAKITKEGVGFMPLDEDGEPIDAENYEALEDEDKDLLKEDISKLYAFSGTILEEIKSLEKEYEMYLDNLEQEMVMEELGYYVTYLKGNYGEYPEIIQYIDAIVEDILENLEIFSKVEAEDAQGLAQIIPWLSPKSVKDIVSRYDVNVIVDHSKQKGAPVITGYPLSYSSLIGKIKIDTEMNTTHTDFMNIYAGLLHRANGGYLIMRMEDLLEAQGTWEGMKRALKTSKIMMENLGGGNITTTLGMVPEAVDLDVKVIIVGNYEVYSILNEYDPSFKKLFKINVDFSESITSTSDSVRQFARLIKTFCDKEKLPAVTREGVARLLEYSHRHAESKEKISANMQPVLDLVREASVFAEAYITEQNILTARKIRMAFKENVQRNIGEKYKKNIFLVDTTGKHIGQINGLAVYQADNFSFGRPVRITCTTYRGKAGVVDVESEVGLSGSIHSKGVQIITGFLGNYFAKEQPLSLSCRICFEQSYGGIDGDSASSTELFAVLSSLAEVPIRQGIAVTGSINQYGKIQPVGGVNDKIEGFYKVCKNKGLTGNQGVIIPYQNKEDLMLDDEVIEAVKEGKFHIYAMSSVKEGMELLTGVPYETVHESVQAKLNAYGDQPVISKKRRKKNV
ncbi:MAG: Lon protease family protein [Cellulosilyticaceae bacterium]